jgi:hypothetical protein
MIRAGTLKNAITNTQTNLGFLNSELNKITFPNSPDHSISFNTNQLNQETIRNLLNTVPTDSDTEIDYIYFFKVSGKDKNIANLKSLFKTEKERQSNNKDEKNDMCRINPVNSKQYFYVGRSQNIKSRLRQHLSHKYKGTYGLHMERWCQELDYNIEILIYKFVNQDNLLIQALEDALWDELKPCLGRKGDR